MKNDEFCISNDGFCINNDEYTVRFGIQNDCDL